MKIQKEKLIIANWKMNKTYQQGIHFIRNFLDNCQIHSLLPNENTKVILLLPFIHLAKAQNILSIQKVQNIFLGAQNCHQQLEGAYTGEISAQMLSDIGISYVLTGHSERREYFLETEDIIAKKLNQIFKYDLTPILCCGETALASLKESISFVQAQIEKSIFNFDFIQLKEINIAYEPVWAIGTNKVATKEHIENIHFAIKELFVKHYGEKITNNLRILYGGSCNIMNYKKILDYQNVDGLLIGGSSLNLRDFLEICIGTT